MHILHSITLVLCLLSTALFSSDKKQSILSSLAISLSKALSLAPYAPSIQSCDPHTVAPKDLWPLIEEYSATNPYLFNDNPTYSCQECGAITSIWHPNNNQWATACADASIKVWDRKTKKVTATLQDSDEPYATTSMDYSPEGKLLAATHTNGRTTLWTPENSKKLCRLYTHADKAIFNKEGTQLVVAPNKDRPEIMALWDIESPHAGIAPHSYTTATVTNRYDKQAFVTSQLTLLNATTVIACHINRSTASTYIRLYDTRSLERKAPTVTAQAGAKVACLDEKTIMYNDNNSLYLIDLRIPIAHHWIRAIELKNNRTIISFDCSKDRQTVLVESHKGAGKKLKHYIEAYDIQTGTCIRLFAKALPLLNAKTPQDYDRVLDEKSRVIPSRPTFSPDSLAFVSTHRAINLWEQQALHEALSKK
jgi:YD repeat-containing protein